MTDESPSPVAIAGGLDQVEHLLAVGQKEKAAELAARFVAESPAEPLALTAVARVHLASGDLEAAQAALDDALRLDAGSVAIHLLRGVVLVRRGRFAEAERAYLSAIELDPESSTTHYCYAELLYLCDCEAAALPAIRRALELDPDDPDSHSLLAKLLLATQPKAWDLSLAAAERALALDPDDASAHAVHGAALLHAGRREEAEEAFRAALERDPSNALSRRGLVEALLSRAFWYRPLFQLGLWGRRHGQGAVVAVVLGLWLVVSAATATLAHRPGGQPVANAITWLYLGACTYTWFGEPITRRILARQYPWMRDLA